MKLRSQIGQVFKAGWDVELAERSASVSGGKAVSLEDYRRRCGVIEGLHLALELLDKAERAVMRIRDDEEKN